MTNTPDVLFRISSDKAAELESRREAHSRMNNPHTAVMGVRARLARGVIAFGLWIGGAKTAVAVTESHPISI